jgi:predicted nucleic acid-binding protein
MPSASTVFVDTNVLLYAFDERDAAKRDQARAWLTWCWHSTLGRVSTQVLHEFYANALRKFTRTLPTHKARAEVVRLRAWKPWNVDDDTVDAAWELQDRIGFSYWDALMVAAAQQQGCRYLLTEDLQHQQQIDGVQVLNPFLVGPGQLAAASA